MNTKKSLKSFSETIVVKQSKTDRINHGFTLIELLVVIAIIAILAGLLLPTLSSVFQRADRSQARSEISSLETAIKAYIAEYGRLPIDDSDQGRDDFTTTAVQSSNIVNRLIAGNPRKINFIESPTGSGEFRDPWSGQYLMIFDSNYDNAIEYETGKTRNTQVIVFSNGDGSGSGRIYSFDP